jgi:peptidoglycan/LPS O-acetylase OafA/YrhL
MNRIPQIEGFRAYLALWVLLDHTFGACGYEASDFLGFTKIARSGALAVDLFIIISGFVIFFLLDKKNESYAKFVTRRFFRLWPLFILLFIAGIPLSLISISNKELFSAIYPETIAINALTISRINSYWEYFWPNIALHIPMLHGLIPRSVIPNAPFAFLGPAWSISLEWQFYLIAPLVMAAIQSKRKWLTTVLCLGCVIVYLIFRMVPEMQSGGFLPMHIHYFFLGVLSYFIFKWIQENSLATEMLPIGFTTSCFLLIISGKSLNLIPLAIWIVFFCFLANLTKDNRLISTKVFGLIFDNPVALYLGKISYSIYLSHYLVIILSQLLILHSLPEIEKHSHFMILLPMTLVFTVLISHFLFKYLEVPGIRLGSYISKRF